MANRYANLVGSNKIKDEWQKINTGFDLVQADMDEKADAGDLTNLQNTVSDHIGSGGNAHAEATTTEAGFMSAADKQKLDGIEEGAQVNQNAFARVNDVEASDSSDELTITGGTGITVTTNPNTKEVIVTATGQSTPGPHGSSHTEHGADPIPTATTTEGGLMSADHVQMLESHASRHATGGPDEITPEMIGAETPEGAQAKVNAHASLTTGVHGATSAATPNTIVQRDANGRAKVAEPVAADDIATKGYADATFLPIGGNSNYVMSRSTITNQDWNTLTENGVYRVSGFTGSNGPTGAYGYGTLIVIQNGNSVTQIYYTHGGGSNTGVWTRTKFGANDWNAWQRFCAGFGDGSYTLSNGGQVLKVGPGSPEGVVTAPPGSLYLNTSGDANTTLYVKRSGTGNTGWFAVA